MSSAFRDLIPPELIKEAIKAGRSALGRMDEDDVPARLRRIAASQGGRLPAPLARGLIAALDDEDWLREKTIEELTDPDAIAEDPSGLFLLRPDGWQFELGRRVERMVLDEAAQRASDLDGQIAVMESREAEAKSRLREAKREIKELKKQKRAEVEDVRSQLRELRESDRQEEVRQAAAFTELEEAHRLAQEAHRQATEETALVKQKLQKVEDHRAEAEKRLQSGATIWGSGDPIALARHLDNLVRTVEADPALLEYTRPPSEREWKLPPGARPDDRNAVDWLLRQPRPYSLLVDGYNVTFRLSGGPDGAARERLNEELSRFKLLAKTPVNVVVVYDSALNPDYETGAGPGGIWLRFTTDSLTADDELRRLAAESEDPVVVVSSDREVREGSEQHGAIAIWAEALVSWIKAR
ncbi:MAG: NYN domain-containing protein [Acidimicrobiia bacterium]